VTDPRLEALLDELLDGVQDPARGRLTATHARIVAAGPLPELPPGLVEAPEPPSASVVRLPRRYRFTAVAAAAAIALVVFAAGWLLGGGRAPDQPVQTVAMSGVGATAAASAELDVFAKDAAGNWPMTLTVRDLAALPAQETYELWLTREGELAERCGSFVVRGAETTVRLNAPYPLRAFDGWVVTAPDETVVLRTTSV
jgi:hypothetical protein